MVNMNAADDQENSETSKINGINRESVACSSKMCTEPQENNTTSHPTIKQNGSSPQNTECKPPISNGACPKVSCFIGVCENGGPSGTRKNNTSFVSYKKPESEMICAESDRGFSLRNNKECQSENVSQQVNIQKQYKPKQVSVRDYDKNSSSEDEECCIYTYRGDSNQMADLPSSFFRMDLMPSNINANSRNSSPDMDYLEMDFDPGASNDRYSSSDSECGDVDEPFAVEASSSSRPQGECELVSEPTVDDLTPVSPLSTPSPVSGLRPQANPEQPYPGVAVSPPSSPPPSLQGKQPTKQDKDSGDEKLSNCCCKENKSSAKSVDENFNEGDSGTMIWKEEEAKEKQVNQIAVSAYGATAVINALLGLNVQFSVNSVKDFVATRMRDETAPVVDYLLSRCNAGATHVDMIRGLQGASQDTVYARFFHMYPRRSINLTNWLSYWIKKGAVPIVTLNLQRGVEPGAEVPDFWHHQMIYGVSARNIYLTNPLEVRTETQLWPQLASPPVLMVRREDVLSRWTPDTPLHALIEPVFPPLWREMNVLGQVVNVIRESSRNNNCTQHIKIPASYSSGITLALLRSSPAYEELRLAPEFTIDPFASR